MLRLGIDIGGSKIALRGMAGERMLFTTRLAVDDRSQPAEVLSSIVAHLRAQRERYGPIATIAIASAPNLDMDGVVSRWPNHPQWEGVAVVPSLAPLATRVVWCDDGTAATLADAWTLGATHLIHLSLGTGVGGGIYFNNRVLKDRELGHLLVYPDGLACACGRSGCLQAYVSGRALERHCRQVAHRAAEAEWVAQAATAIAVCASNLIELFHSAQITLGGGLSNRFPELPAAVAQNLQQKFLKAPLPMPQIMRSPHGDEAALHGALAVAAASDAEQAAACEVWVAR